MCSFRVQCTFIVFSLLFRIGEVSLTSACIFSTILVFSKPFLKTNMFSLEKPKT